MEAQLLKGVPFVGELFRVILWPVGKLFEYRVTRTLNDPKLDEVYVIPKLLLFPLQPIKTLKEVFGDDEKLTTALLDRLADRATVIVTKGKSYRMRRRQAPPTAPEPEEPETTKPKKR